MAVLAVTAVAVAMIVAGQDRKAEPEVAGGYEVERGDSCLGRRFDLKQSGRYVDLQNGSGTLSGALKLQDRRLTGEVDCVGGGSRHIDAQLRGPRIRGTLGAEPVSAQLSGDLPVASAQRRRTPNSIAGDYELSPHSPCLGDDLVVKGDGTDVRLVSGDRTLGRGRYTDGVL